MNKPQFVGTGSDITADWMNRAFAAGGAEFPAVTQVSVVPFDADQGFLGALLRCRLTYAAEAPQAPTSVIVKLPGHDRQGRVMSRRRRLHEREYEFYTRLGNELPVRTPRVYYADYDAETDDVVLVQEDLAGMVQVGRLAGATAEQAHTAIRNLAMLHSQFLGGTRDDRIAANVWKESSRREFRRLQVLYMASLPVVRRRFKDCFSPRINRLALELGCSLTRYGLRAPLTPLTFTHGDYHLDNLFYDPGDPSRLTIIDWQLSAIGAGMHDVARFMTTSVEPEVRRSIEREVVEEYADAMARAGTDLAFDVWWRDYRAKILATLVPGVLFGGSLAAASGLAYELEHAAWRRRCVALEDLNAGELLSLEPPGLSAKLFWFGLHGVFRGLAALRRRN